jgi:hypothetical protein
MEVNDQFHDPAALPPPPGKSPRYSLVRGWEGPRAGLDVAAMRKIPALAGNRSPIVQPVA